MGIGFGRRMNTFALKGSAPPLTRRARPTWPLSCRRAGTRPAPRPVVSPYDYSCGKVSCQTWPIVDIGRLNQTYTCYT